MCAVVGPNGCGKSNVIDAVRWVMGESSAKNLRGESMADVIFNGSVNRQPVGQAFIELVFDNSDGGIGGEYASYAEISIKRLVTREGQSEYFLNGTKCRRRDITDIFLGTGLGPRSYAIIEQGMISRLIESKPEDLRVFIEEAAGISKYKERRRETESRMPIAVSVIARELPPYEISGSGMPVSGSVRVTPSACGLPPEVRHFARTASVRHAGCGRPGISETYATKTVCPVK